jgi:hypothetical protein
MDIRNNIINFIKNNIKQFSYVSIFVVCLFIILGLHNQIINYIKINEKQSITIQDEDGIKANYKSDMNFLECIGEQHACLFKNIDKGKNTIINNCKKESFCNEVYNNTIDVKSN